MNLTNIKLIWFRELRDQLRDRRTLFMIFVLPVLLYPLLGMCFLQIQQLTRQQTFRIWVVGITDVEQLGYVPMLDPKGPGNRFSPTLFSPDGPFQPKQFELAFAPDEPQFGKGAAIESDESAAKRLKAQRADAWSKVQSGEYDAALFFPHDFAGRLEKAYQGTGTDQQLLEPEILFANRNDRSMTADMVLREVVGTWSSEVGKQIRETLTNRGVRVVRDMPIRPLTVNVDKDTPYEGAAMWSKILPVLLLIWAMTGAFYPAVDLCAGEKERGTLETLLSSPAERSEIVLGKLATIMVFSMVTAILNIISISMMGWLILSDLPDFGPPPASAILWLTVALIPVSALFSALCLALAAFARSTKEGQYYLMPLLLITMPLAVLPMTSALELTMGTALVPVTGVVILLRNVLEGNFLPVLQYLPVVAAVTLAACLLSIRWAIDQFNSESVLFRESEQLDVRLWLRHLWRDRQPTPTVSLAITCATVILLTRIVVTFLATQPEDFAGLAWTTLVMQVAIIALPAVLMAFALTRNPVRTLLLRRPRWLAAVAAAALAVAVHPVIHSLGEAVQRLYPPSSDLEQMSAKLDQLFQGVSMWQKILLIALLPAICEELAFRGFILSGLRHLGHKWRAIIFSAILFGVTHLILQQAILASLTGAIIGYVAVQTGSLFPCIVYHLVHNSLMLLIEQIADWLLRLGSGMEHLVSKQGDVVTYHWPMVVVGLFVSLGLLWWFSRLPCEKSAEEELQEAMARADEDEDNLP